MRFIRQGLRQASASSGSVRAEKLYGIDAVTQERETSITRADGQSSFLEKITPGCVNMIRKSEGTVKKRPAYSIISHPDTLSGIGGVYVYKAYNRDILFYVKGDTIEMVDGDRTTTFKTNYNLDGSRAVQYDEYLVLINKEGMSIVRAGRGEINYWSNKSLSDLNTYAYIPTIYIGNTPNGAGSAYEGVNRLTDRVCELYQGDGESCEFKTHLKATDYVIYIKSDSGEWSARDPDYITNYSVAFKTAPPKPSVAGEDNVKIEYKMKDAKTPAWDLSQCTCGAVYGAGGLKDRLFLSGSFAAPGMVFYSALENPFYFPEYNYINVGGYENDIYGLINHDSALAVLTKDAVYTITSDDSISAAVLHDAVFKISDVYVTPEPVSPQNSYLFDGEPVYLTKNGVCSLTASGILDERCAQIRSARINLHLLKENLKECIAMPFKDYFVISNCSDTLYLLDGKQFSTDSAQPFSSRQYEGYIWKGINAKMLWVQNDKLCFSNGEHAYCFNNERIFADEVAPGEFCDIEAFWETPYIYCGDFKDFKFFNRIGILVDGTDESGAEKGTDFEMFVRFDNEPWRAVKKYGALLSMFDYGVIDYGCFNYSGRVKNYALSVKLLHKKGRGIKIRFQNSKKNQPFTMLRFGIDFMKM